MVISTPVVNLVLVYFPEAMVHLAVTMATRNMVCYLALGLGFNLNAFFSWFLMPNLHRIKNPNPVLFLCKFIKNNKGSQGNVIKLSMFTHKQLVNIHRNKNMAFNFTLVNNYCMVNKVNLVSMFIAAGASKML